MSQQGPSAPDNIVLLGLSKFSTFGDVKKYFSEDIELQSENEFSHFQNWV